MKVKIWTTSQSEFDSKKDLLVKALSKSLPDYREPVYQSQREVFEYWDRKFKAMLEEIKKDINEILEEK